MLRLVAVFTLLLSSNAWAGRENAVAVLDIAGTGIAPELLPTLTEVLTVEIADIGLYKVIAGRDIQSMLGFEKQKDMVGCTDAACLAEIGGALGVDRIVAGHIGMVGSTYVVNIKLINIRMADTEARVYETVRGEVDALIATIKTSVQKLLGQGSKAAIALGGAAGAARPVAAAAPPPTHQSAAPAPTATQSQPAAGTQVATASQPAATVEKSSGRSIGILPIVLWGAGAVGLAAGTAMGLMAKSAERKANDRTFTGAQKQIDVAKRDATISTIGFGAGGLLAAGGFAMWLFGGGSGSASAWVPMVSPSAVGVAYGASF